MPPVKDDLNLSRLAQVGFEPVFSDVAGRSTNFAKFRKIVETLALREPERERERKREREQ